VRTLQRDVVIIGGGPAGLSAAVEAARAGADVLLIDENRQPGGQLLKQIHKFFGSKEHSAGIRGINIGKSLLQEAEQLGVEVWLNAAAIGLFENNQVAVLKDGETLSITGKRLLWQPVLRRTRYTSRAGRCLESWEQELLRP